MTTPADALAIEPAWPPAPLATRTLSIIKCRLTTFAENAAAGRRLHQSSSMNISGPRSKTNIELNLCGEPSFASPNQARIGLEPKDAFVLAYLAIEGATPRSRLAELLWPDATPGRALANLRQRLLRLKRMLGFELILPGRNANLSPDLNLDICLDAGHERLQVLPLLPSVEQYLGDAAAHWLQAARARHSNAQLNRISAMCDAMESAGEIVQAIELAGRALQLVPQSEPFYRRVMRLNYLRGDRVTALATYAECVAVLDEDLGIRPSDETRSLAHQINGLTNTPLSAESTTPVTIVRPPRMIGRESVLNELAVAARRNAVVVLLGDAGMGKSRLVNDFAASHPFTLVVSSRPGDSELPYAVVSRLLRGVLNHKEALPEVAVRTEIAKLLPELGPAAEALPDLEAGRYRFLHAIQSVLIAASARAETDTICRCVIDDLHHADASSVEALATLVSGVPDLHWIITARGQELSRVARDWLDRLVLGHAAVEIRLESLNPLQVQEFVASLEIPAIDTPSMAGKLVRHTGGNPYLLLETIRTLIHQKLELNEPVALTLPVPASIRPLIERRIARLSEPALGLLRCAAVAGQDFCIDLAVAVLDSSPMALVTPWTELEGGQFLHQGEFVHDLMREAVYCLLPQPLAQILHGQTAEWLELCRSAQGRAAQHWVKARRPRRASLALVRAAKSAGDVYRRLEQIAFLNAAFDQLIELGDRAEAFAIAIRVGELFTSDGNAQEVAKHIARLQTLAQSPDERCIAARQASEMLFNLGQYVNAVNCARVCLDSANLAQADCVNVAILRSQHGFALVAADKLDDAELQFSMAHPILEEHDNLALRISHLGNIAYFYKTRGYLEQDIATKGKILTLLGQSVADETTRASVLRNMSLSHALLGQAERGLSALQACRYITTRLEMKGLDAQAATSMGILLRDLGRYSEALEQLLSAKEYLSKSNAGFEAESSLALAHTYLQLGQFELARKALDSIDATKTLPVFGILVSLTAIEIALAQEPSSLQSATDDIDDLNTTALRGWPSQNPRYQTYRLMLAKYLPPAQGLKVATEVLNAFESLDYLTTKLQAHAYRASCALRLNLLDLAQQEAELAWAMQRRVEAVPHVYRAEIGLTVWKVINTLGLPEAKAILDETVRWVLEAEQRYVPREYRHTFLKCNPTNVALIAATSTWERLYAESVPPTKPRT